MAFDITGPLYPGVIETKLLVPSCQLKQSSQPPVPTEVQELRVSLAAVLSCPCLPKVPYNGVPVWWLTLATKFSCFQLSLSGPLPKHHLSGYQYFASPLSSVMSDRVLSWTHGFGMVCILILLCNIYVA